MMELFFHFITKDIGLWELSMLFSLVVFSYIYGGMSYGYLKNTNLIFSQILSMLCANVAIYFANSIAVS